MKVTTKLAQLRSNYGNISYEEISESTGIDRQELRELENGEAGDEALLPPKAIAFTTLAQLCAFFHCSPNDLLIVDWEGEEIAPPTTEEIEKASQIIKQAFARAEAMPPRSAEEIWDSFEGTIERMFYGIKSRPTPL
ncbi:MAG: helix-turn-helix transcriptional regulator [Moorea sp. SIO4A3]|nr:helix-turn-helix transcriptional regulator [Moorena sp. SIO4A3]